MSAPVKRAAYTAAKSVIPQASRAVTPAQAKNIVPNATSSTETSMPWEGWFTSFLNKSLGDKTYQKLRSYIVFMPQDIHNLEQQPLPGTKVPLTEDGKITAQFRYPSPGSQPRVVQPDEDDGTMYEDPYIGSYYTRDTRRRFDDPAFPNPELEAAKLAILPEDDPRVKEMMENFEEGPKSSPGNKGMFATGHSDIDSLRAAMSTNHASVNESLDDNMPDHLPAPNWWDEQTKVVEWHKEKKLPIPIGRTEWGTIPTRGRLARW